jgi:ABC-type bacteriocin/lantibiotic exporter with double-glycine peptidase domain
VPKVLLSVPHQLQQTDGDCLAACAAMVLGYLGRAIEYAQLLRQLAAQQLRSAARGAFRLERSVRRLNAHNSWAVAVVRASWSAIE